ncbi:hypothetical protein SO694_0001623 [Aureococcus anophagefferens]|uniref:Uncharacterized protein n=1 Tax=Aureococcus anophagefferens TaxID=44056 RepID=A0ABR1G334_AURAN
MQRSWLFFHLQPLFRAPSDMQSRSSSISSRLAFRHFSFLKLHAQMFAYFFLWRLLVLDLGALLALALALLAALAPGAVGLVRGVLAHLAARDVGARAAPLGLLGRGARRRSFSSSNATFSVLVSDASRPLSTDATPFFATASAADEAAGWRCLKTSTTASTGSAFVFSLTTPPPRRR